MGELPAVMCSWRVGTARISDVKDESAGRGASVRRSPSRAIIPRCDSVPRTHPSRYARPGTEPEPSSESTASARAAGARSSGRTSTSRLTSPGPTMEPCPSSRTACRISFRPEESTERSSPAKLRISANGSENRERASSAGSFSISREGSGLGRTRYREVAGGLPGRGIQQRLPEHVSIPETEGRGSPGVFGRARSRARGFLERREADRARVDELALDERRDPEHPFPVPEDGAREGRGRHSCSTPQTLRDSRTPPQPRTSIPAARRISPSRNGPGNPHSQRPWRSVPRSPVMTKPG